MSLQKLEQHRRLGGVLDRREATCPAGVSRRVEPANQTTSIYTQVSIEQLKAVHARTRPAESKEPDEKPGPDDAPETPEN